jgi:NAD(P)-dependent dehydrogenase (short-subunit alcohol dehydrogenase family)
LIADSAPSRKLPVTPQLHRVEPLLIRGALSPPHPSGTFYAATKAEVFILTPRFATLTLITVNAVAPSFVRTDTTLTGPCVCLGAGCAQRQPSGAPSLHEAREQTARVVPLGRRKGET